MLKTVKGIIKPDGKIALEEYKLPQFPIRVLVTILNEAASEEERLSEVGDYLERLEDYEEQLSKGKIQWK